MTVLHHIILGSSYSTGRRIALHHPFEGPIDSEGMHRTLERIEGCYGGPVVSLGVHVRPTGSASWSSVVERDPYFKDVQVLDTVDRFIELVRRDRTFTGLEASDYILSVHPCTHSRLEILTYMCYADYLCDTGERLFEDNLLVTDDGPAVEGVFLRYGGLESVLKPVYGTLPIRSRLFSAANGRRKVSSMDRTLGRLVAVPTEDLIDMANREGSPCSRVDAYDDVEPLPDDLILEYHHVERDV